MSGTRSVSIPGLTVHGWLRVDPASAVALFTGLFDGTGRRTHQLPVPNVPSLSGFAFDVQTLDLDVAASAVAFADNDLTLVVAVQPPNGLVAIPAGTFTMGSNASSAEAPQHQVTISRPFWMGRTEVKQSEFQALMGYNPSLFLGPDRPVEVSWNQAMAYCNALTARESAAGRLPSGYVYRLPTEAEWEYACRAGTTGDYHFGASISCALANAYHDNGGVGFCHPHPTEGGQTANVGSYPANAFGLHDMHGNVAEWCLDHWPGPISTYPSTPVTDPLESNPLYVYRVARGGAWLFYRDAARSSARNGNLPATWTHFFGMRVVLAPAL